MQPGSILFNTIPHFKDEQNKDDERKAHLRFHYYKEVIGHLSLVIGKSKKTEFVRKIPNIKFSTLFRIFRILSLFGDLTH